MNRKIRVFLALWLLCGLVACPQAHAGGIPLIMRGAGRTFFSVFQIPKDMITYAPKAFPVGLVAGTVTGTMKAVAGTVVGAFDMARGAAPYAKYLIFL